VVLLDGTKLITTHGPHWRLLIVGAGQMTQYLAQMAQALDYQVTLMRPAGGIHARALPACSTARTCPTTRYRH
jgi:xanthine/CO dehydrogenase XdhC/CoxF family maturation factor